MYPSKRQGAESDSTHKAMRRPTVRRFRAQMKLIAALLVFSVVSALGAGTSARSEEGPPAWAFR
jgi:hypothetical protein